jgi:adenylate cyclase
MKKSTSAEGSVQRKLTTILAADVEGYTRLMHVDEEATLKTLGEYLGIMDRLITRHDGRVFSKGGDSVLAEFGSAVEAVRCAISIQEEIASRNTELADDRKLTFRIGINVGDVMVRDGDLFGDAVNVAARLEGMAEAGGVFISGSVFEQVKHKLSFGFEDIGSQEVKNIDELVQVWKWIADGPAVGASKAAASEVLSLPDKPSMVVLPFDNMSSEAEQEYFADGLTEDIITEISRFQAFFVVARNSAFVYKGKPVKVQNVGRELGVRYVVEGSVRKAGNRVRVTVQLIEAASGNHIWAERYDHDLTDMFELQDEVTRSIVAAIPGRLASADLDRVKRKHLKNMAAYDYTLRGRAHHHRGTKEDNAEALRVLDKAIELDPELAEAYAWKSCTLGQAQARDFGDNKEELLAWEVEAAERAISLDENNITGQWNMCEMHMMIARLEQAELHHQKAFTLNPNDPRIVAQRGELLTWQGRPEEGADWARRAMRLDPYDAAGRAHLLGRALYVARRYEDAIEAFKQVRLPRYGHHAEIAGCHAQLGSGVKAGLHAKEVMYLKPGFSIADHVQGLPFKESRDREHYRDGLSKAGLP